MPTVSIITPVYNAEVHLSAMIDSVIAQTFQDWELLLVDDCSTDQSLTIAHSYADLDSRIKVFQLNENSGAAVARNSAIKEAVGRYIAFLDSDDIWLRDKLEHQLEFMQFNSYALTYTAYQLLSPKGQLLEKQYHPPGSLTYKQLLRSNQIGCLTAIYDASILGKVYMPNIRARQDYALWLNILKKIDRAHGLDEVLALYRISPKSLSSSKIKMVKYNWKLFRETQGFSLIRSVYYIGWNIYRKLSS